MKMKNSTFIFGASVLTGSLAGAGSNVWIGSATVVGIWSVLIVLDAIRDQLVEIWIKPR